MQQAFYGGDLIGFQKGTSISGAAPAWVAIVFMIGTKSTAITTCLLLIYPLWDAVANIVDARQSGGLGRNLTQSINAAVSVLTSVAVAIALGRGMNAVLFVFGVWASLSGLLQLATGIRRWKLMGAQWAMILSGLQSALAAAHFIQRGLGSEQQDITVIAPYAAFGALYFLISGISLLVADKRRRNAELKTATINSRRN